MENAAETIAWLAMMEETTAATNVGQYKGPTWKSQDN